MRDDSTPLAQRLPAAPGVYRFRDAARAGAVHRPGHRAAQPGGVVLVGPARPATTWPPWSPPSPGSRRWLRLRPTRPAWLERNLLEAGLPRWNRTPGGQETVVYLRLDRRPGSPGLTVDHLSLPDTGEVRYFGPYLGGLRARQAAAALGRILPLAYAGAQLRARIATWPGPGA